MESLKKIAELGNYLDEKGYIKESVQVDKILKVIGTSIFEKMKEPFAGGETASSTPVDPTPNDPVQEENPTPKAPEVEPGSARATGVDLGILGKAHSASQLIAASEKVSMEHLIYYIYRDIKKDAKAGAIAAKDKDLTRAINDAAAAKLIEDDRPKEDRPQWYDKLNPFGK